MNGETEKTESKQERPWLFQPGQSGNPKGRPKGTFSLKTFAKKMLEEMNDDEKKEFMKGLPKEVIWKMAEGNPKQDTETNLKAEVSVNIVSYKDANNNDSV